MASSAAASTSSATAATARARKQRRRQARPSAESCRKRRLSAARNVHPRAPGHPPPRITHPGPGSASLVPGGVWPCRNCVPLRPRCNSDGQALGTQRSVPTQAVPPGQQRSLSQQTFPVRHEPELFGQHVNPSFVQLPLAHGTGASPGQQSEGPPAGGQTGKFAGQHVTGEPTSQQTSSSFGQHGSLPARHRNPWSNLHLAINWQHWRFTRIAQLDERLDGGIRLYAERFDVLCAFRRQTIAALLTLLPALAALLGDLHAGMGPRRSGGRR